MVVPLPKRQALEAMLLKVLFESDKPLSVHEILAEVGKLAKIDPQYRPTISTNSKRTDLDYKLAWLRTSMKKEGLIERTGFGVWKITSKGREKVEIDRKL